MSNFKMKCPHCGAYLRINETGEIAPGNRMREEAMCPVCHEEAYSTLTSGFVKAYQITEEEYNAPTNYWD